MLSLLTHFYRAAAWAGVINKNYSLVHNSAKGHPLRVDALLHAGADVHFNEDIAVRLASWEGQAEVVQVLLDGGADGHAHDDEALRWTQRQTYGGWEEEGRHRGTERVLEEWISSHPRV
jgi:hypothetical protein